MIRLLYIKRKKKYRKNRRLALSKCPQKKGVCTKVYTKSPKKPNSAVRKVCNVYLSNKFRPICYIPGEGHNLQRYSTVLIRGGRAQDLPGVKYRCVPGKYDFISNQNRKNRRSIYGIKK